MNLYIFHEGEHDKKFFKFFLETNLLEKYKCNKLIQINYATVKDDDIRNMIKTILETKNIFLVFGDADFKNLRNQKPKAYDDIHKYLAKRFNISHDISDEALFIVVEEIESWYLAGFDQTFCKKNQVKFHKNTETVTAEMFSSSRIRPEQSEDQFRNWLIKNKKDYNLNEAIARNNSIKRFLEKNFSDLQKLLIVK